MKTYLIAAALAISNVYSVSTYWGQDSPSAFNLTITGVGIDYFQTFYFYYNDELVGPNGTQNIYRETFTSPSGLWELGADINVSDWSGPGVGDLCISHVNVSSTFLGLPETPSILAAGRGGEPMYFTKSTYSEVDFVTEGTIFKGWDGAVTYMITSIPDYRDPTTWGWVMNIASDGPRLTNSVPDSGGLACLAFAAGLLLFFRPRKEKAWTS